MDGSKELQGGKESEGKKASSKVISFRVFAGIDSWHDGFGRCSYDRLVLTSTFTFHCPNVLAETYFDVFPRANACRVWQGVHGSYQHKPACVWGKRHESACRARLQKQNARERTRARAAQGVGENAAQQIAVFFCCLVSRFGYLLQCFC